MTLSSSPQLKTSPDLPNLAELQLQQELCSLFEVDTQKDLQAYLNLAQNLCSQSWTTDIQTLYRCIHTIKGGAATVGADAILHIAIVLEDLLSDLRYLDTAPFLEDDQLRQMLLEGGELLASAISLKAVGDDALAVIEPKLKRLQVLREQIQKTYLPEWNEQAQLQCEFAEQGFDLVVLELEIALDQLSNQESVPAATIDLAEELLEQLKEIGEELQLTVGWSDLLQEARSLLTQTEGAIWQVQWPVLFQALKTCAKQGGQVVSPLWASSEDEIGEEITPNPELVEDNSPDSLGEIFSDWAEMGDILDELAGTPQESDKALKKAGGSDPRLRGEETEGWQWAEDSEQSEQAVVTPPQLQAQPLSQTQDKIQVPVPLERLDLSAQHLVDTLLAARATQGSYQTLHPQLLQMVVLAQESVQYITHLRQLQDDYALLDNLRHQTGDAGLGLTPERYRKGYTTINRLLENSLRLSELGAETEQTARKTAEQLQQLDRQILLLRDTIEDSRLLPFQNLSFRARAILRDLTNRYGKPAKLVVEGESLELDVGTLKALEPVLLHLIRNAYDHGLESSPERAIKGKPESGTLTLSLQRSGSTFLLKLQDDGRGLDTQGIQARAKELGLPLTRTQTPTDLLGVLCQPGFSSQSQVSELSGRGVGMDVVATQVASLGGQLSLDTVPGLGTTFFLKFPVPHLLVSCLLLQAGDRTFAIATQQIGNTALFGQLAVSQKDDPCYCYDWEIGRGATATPGLDLLTYWHPRSRTRLLADTAICVYVRSQEGQPGVWLLADKLLGQSDLLIKPLPSPLLAPNGLMGVSLQSDGTLIPVLEVTALVEELLGSPTTTLAASPAMVENPIPVDEILKEETVEALAPKILIVDDAALMRRRIEASLSAYGYLTDTCADGLEAWNWLQSHPQPALIITDIEMPNMDGFTLIEQCRKAGITVPLLVISSRLAEEWGREARRLGATNFLTKGFSTTELIHQIQACLSVSDRATK